MAFSSTKNICTCCFISIFLIVLFVISPLSQFSKTSLFMKIAVIIILIYTFYLMIKQTNEMKTHYNDSKSNEITNQLNLNILCSYVFTFSIGLLIIFILKSFF